MIQNWNQGPGFLPFFLVEEFCGLCGVGGLCVGELGGVLSMLSTLKISGSCFKICGVVSNKSIIANVIAALCWGSSSLEIVDWVRSIWTVVSVILHLKVVDVVGASCVSNKLAIK